MVKKKQTNMSDINILDAQIVAKATDKEAGKSLGAEPEKNPAAVALGRLGGLKGGKARAKKLSAKKRKEIAQKAALSRWAAKSEKH